LFKIQDSTFSISILEKPGKAARKYLSGLKVFFHVLAIGKYLLFCIMNLPAGHKVL
jgi:hypothetical protein